MSREITPRQAKFVAAFLAGKSGHEAAREAGYAESAVHSRSQYLIHRCPATVEAIAAGRKTLQLNTAFDALQAFKELDKAIEFAEKTRNASAIVKAIETKARLVGLIEKDKGRVHLELNLNEIRALVGAGRQRVNALSLAEGRGPAGFIDLTE